MSKTQISAEIIADSVNEAGERITSFILTFPRFILAELNTHRAFSRNSASSRAIPFKTMVKKVQDDPFIPIAWQKEHTGMQGTEYFDDWEEIEELRASWRMARTAAVEAATRFNNDKVTKQLTNRLLEPFLWHRVLCTATEFENFFELRCPQYFNNMDEKSYRSRKDYMKARNELSKELFKGECPDFFPIEQWKYEPQTVDSFDEITWLRLNSSGAEIHISRLAECMWDAYNESTPKALARGEWHIPFGDNIDEEELTRFYYKSREGGMFVSKTTKQFHLRQLKVKISTARCARTSYDNFEGTIDFEKDIKLYDNLLNSKHMSPFEHCAMSTTPNHRSRNFVGFTQYREIIEHKMDWRKLLNEEA